MSTTISGNYALTLDNARKLLAGSSIFRALMSAATATIAKGMIYWILTDDVHDYAQSQMPRAIVQYGESYRVNRISSTGWKSSGPIEAAIEIPLPEAYRSDLQEGLLWFSTQISQMVDQMKSMATSGAEDSLNPGNTYLNVTEIEINYAGRGEPENNPTGNAYLLAAITIHWEGI